jgi:putative flippase GtrA
VPIQRVKGFLGYLYRHHFIRYLFVGGTTFMIDFGLLILLHGHLNISLPVATSIAYWSSIGYNFYLNRWWTFSAGEKANLHRHALSYGVLLGFNYLFTVIFVAAASKHVNYAVAKAISVGIQMSWTYVIYKNVIFTQTKPTDTSAGTTATTSTV